MNWQQTTARLIGNAIITIIEKQKPFGILAQELPPFDVVTLFKKLEASLNQQSFMLALVGFKEISEIVHPLVAKTVEKAIEWRNDPPIEAPLAVLLNPQSPHEKTHSLGLLEPFRDVDLQQYILRKGEDSGNGAHQTLWKVLQRKKVQRSIPLVAVQLAQLYHALEVEKVQLGTALPNIGLLQDPSLTNYVEKSKKLIQRLENNNDWAQALIGLDKSRYRALGRAMSDDDGQINQLRRTYLLVQRYIQKPSRESFNELIFDDVDALFTTPKRALSHPAETPTSQPSTTSIREKSIPPLDEYVIDQFLSLDKEKQAEAEQLAKEYNGWLRENPDSDESWRQKEGIEEFNTTFLVDGQERTIHPPKEEVMHPLEEYMRTWVRSNVWGGIIELQASDHNSAAISSIPDLFKGAIPLPLITSFSVESLIKLFDELESFLGGTNGSEEHLGESLREFKKKRDFLADYRTQLLYQPILATLDPDLLPFIEEYIDIHQQLTSRLQGLYSQGKELFHDSIERATAQFLALDMVIINLPDNSKSALLTTLHPLHLWKWADLARRIQSTQESLTKAEHKMILTTIHSLPTLLNTLLLHPSMSPTPGGLKEQRLVVAGEIGHNSSEGTVGIPFYLPSARQSITTDGLERLPELLKKVLAFYPPARVGLKMVIINPPALLPILKAAVELYYQESGSLLHGADIKIYYPSSQSPASEPWLLKDEKTLTLFRDHRLWNFTIDLKCDSYDEMVKDITKNNSPHIVLLFDPSEAVIRPIIRTVGERPNPFTIPVQVNYDRISDAVEFVLAPSGGIFDRYALLRNSLTNELHQRVYGESNRPAIKEEQIKKLLHEEMGAHWLVVVDRLHGTLELRGVGERLAWYPVRSRTLAVHSNPADWKEHWKEQVADHLRRLELPLDASQLLAQFSEVIPILPEGLLSTISNPIADENKPLRLTLDDTAFNRLLALTITLRWYRSDNPTAVLVNVDAQQFKDWFGDLQPLKTAFMAWRHADKQLFVDVIAVLAYDSEPLPPLTEAEKGLPKLEGFASTLESLFAPDADNTLMAPLRRNLLRTFLNVAVFSPTATLPTTDSRKRRQFKAEWAPVINNLFTDYLLQIRLRVVRVTLQKHGSLDIQKLPQKIYPTDIVTLPRVLPDTIQAKAPPIDSSRQDQSVPSAPSAAKSIQEVTPEQVEQAQIPKETSPNMEVPKERTQSIEVPKEISKQAARLRQVLMNYGIAIAGVDTERTQIGPRMIRYWVQLQPPAGRLSEVQKYAEDIAREMGIKNVPLIDNIPGERYVGIDIAREQPEKLPISPALHALPHEQPYELLVAMGQNPAGESVTWDLAKLPHMLVAGSTGSGKTMFLSALISSLVWRHSAQDLALLLVDPKQTDFFIFEELPHLREGRIFYEPEESIAALQLLTGDERDKRTALIRKNRCPNILEYNRRNPTQRLPRIVVVIDEFADIMLTLSRKERKEFERQIGRLAATGRSIGIHLVLATQRPTTDVITGTLKANIPARVSFRLPSAIDSRTILDRTGGQYLLGQGDMLALKGGDMERIQGYYAPYDELDQLLSKLGENQDATPRD